MAYTHALFAFHWSWLTPMQCLLFIGHRLYLCNALFPLVTAYTHTLLFFLVVTLLILSTAGCTCQQHLPGSLQVKVILQLQSSMLASTLWGVPLSNFWMSHYIIPHTKMINICSYEVTNKSSWLSFADANKIHIYKTKRYMNIDPIYPTPPLGQDMTQGQFFKRSLTGFNSEFSFS